MCIIAPLYALDLFASSPWSAKSKIQAIVKGLFRNKEFRNEVNLGAVNSINWARILAQIVYYFYAYLKVCPKPTSAEEDMPKISFSVPTGNFGDILAGYYAKRKSLPVILVIEFNEKH